jgi:hypothetical protein
MGTLHRAEKRKNRRVKQISVVEVFKKAKRNTETECPEEDQERVVKFASEDSRRDQPENEDRDA